MENSNNLSKIIYSTQIVDEIISLKSRYTGNIFLLTESKFYKLWHNELFSHLDMPILILPSGEENKNIDNVLKAWDFLAKNEAKRDSLLVNIGGGMISDLGGFAASTFKRGINVANVPTTLLSQVDASVGGKTGINFNNLKNEIGTFNTPDYILIFSKFIKTLDRPNLLSGYAEMIKHGLIFNNSYLRKVFRFDMENPNYQYLQSIIKQSIEIKEYFTRRDPHEENIRKALNFGHTIGHALETWAMEKQNPVLHGFAVAWGMIAEIWLSTEKCGFPLEKAEEISQQLIELYGKPQLENTDYEHIYQLMRHDKKNDADAINFTLLSNVGQYVINQNCNLKAQIFEALNFLKQF